MGACLLTLWGLATGAHAGALSISPRVLRDERFCLGCHSAEAQAEKAPRVDASTLHGSAHSSLTCVDCHREIDATPHGQPIQRVDCGRCHRREAELRTVSGRGEAASPHAVARAAAARPTCVDCHGGHQVGGVGDISSQVGRNSIADTCGRCHSRQAQEYVASVHGGALLNRNPDVPTCATCHPEHVSVSPPGIPQSGVVATCVSCHEDPGLQARYAIATDRLASYLGSYHGAATDLGDSRTANCASCHGNHHILPSSDPRSSVHPANLPDTCGHCHPGANQNVTRGRVHVLPEPGSAAALYYVNLGFRWFTFSILAALMGHILLELFGRWRGRNGT